MAKMIAFDQEAQEAMRRGVGLIAMKPLASGSIMKLDPRARPPMSIDASREKPAARLRLRVRLW